MKYLFYILTFTLLLSCKSADLGETPNSDSEMYFPPLASTDWQTTNPADLQWQTDNLPTLYDYLENNGTKGFIILKNGKIVVEKYFNGHSQHAKHNWYSAAKTLTSLTVGIAEQEGFLSINDKTSDYLGVNWTSLPIEKENLIHIKHQLTMTTGLNDANFSSTLPADLTFLADAGTRWAYHNGPYTLLQNVVENATNTNFSDYFNEKIATKIGLNGFWFTYGDLHIYRSDTRSMARFGLLILNQGYWNNEQLINQTYFNAMTNTSQNINKSYGYLWWLNGKENFMRPASQTVYDGSIIPNAPNDLIAALGANDQKIYVIPSKSMVIVRCGDSSGTTNLAISGFDNVLWEKLNNIIP